MPLILLVLDLGDTINAVVDGRVDGLALYIGALKFAQKQQPGRHVTGTTCLPQDVCKHRMFANTAKTAIYYGHILSMTG